MGAGKSYTIRHLSLQNRFPLHQFLIIDPDIIRHHLPEFQQYLSTNAETAGEYTRKEAGYIAELLTIIGLEMGLNVLVDGSLKDWRWYEEYFSRLRGDYFLRIAVLHIVAPREAVLNRAKTRSKITGRVVPQSTLEESIETVPKSVSKLKHKVDFFAELVNAPGASDIELVTENMSWDSFRQVWVSRCYPSSSLKAKSESSLSLIYPLIDKEGEHVIDEEQFQTLHTDSLDNEVGKYSPSQSSLLSQEQIQSRL